MKLPEPTTQGTVAVEQAMNQRRTVRSFLPKMLSLDQLAQLLWSAQGITGNDGFKRAAPSAGALYPMDIYVAAGQGCVGQLEAGVYHYEAGRHMLSRVAKNDLRDDLARASLSQMWMAGAPVNLVITAEYNRVGIKYGERGVRYAMIEAGHIGQNIFLQAEALGLKAGIVGAFHDTKLSKVLNLPRTHEPLLVMPVGYSANGEE
ncbi:MAG: SagB/ThcOx family dehydrogenase [Desulfobacteraceae bacterium]|nr:SagB/ThcOx family dehydrogenase [Desulfobacteraceae bacterium]